MRVYSFVDHDVESARLDGDSVVIDDAWRDSLSGAADDSLGDFLDHLERARGKHRATASLVTAAAVHRPGKVICVGLNYREHVAEGGRDPRSRPVLFSKFANAVIASGEPIVRPEGTHALDLEVELGVVIGSTARRVSVDDAMDHVAGYVVVNDVSARDWQGVPAALHEGEKGDGQWLRAKGSDTFLPMGPVFVTPDEISLRASDFEAGASRPTARSTRCRTAPPST